MTSQLKQQDIDLWEAWIEYDHSNPGKFGTLYVIGEIMVEHHSPHADIRKKETAGNNCLVLQVPPRPSGRYRRKEVLYSEAVHDISQYSAITIYEGADLIASFE